MHYHGTKLPLGHSRALHIRTETAPLLKLSRDAGGTVTEYMTALLLRSFSEVLAENSDSQKQVKISVPINLRNIFPSDTLRNFTYFANVGEPLSKFNEPFEKTLQSIKNQLYALKQPESLIARINPNVSSEQNLLLRAAPLSLKQLVMRQAHHILGDDLFTASFSNLGQIILDDSISRHICGFDFGLSVSDLIPLNLSMLSFANVMFMTFSSGIEEKDVERIFVRKLSEKGLYLEIFSSEPEDGGKNGVLS
jgi:hypothetical protein